jgi:hypothetical protein
MVRIWEAYLGDHPKSRSLPAILPVVLHHSETGWHGKTTFEALLDVDEETLTAIAELVPRFRFVLDDISAEADEALMARAITALGRLALWCLRHGREPAELVRRLAGWADLVRQVRGAPNGAAAFATILRYILTVSEPLPPEELLTQLLEAAGKDAEEEIVNVADQLREEGRRKGLAEGVAKGVVEGVAKGQRKVLLRLLRARFGALPEPVMARIRAADEAQLDAWADRVLTAPTLEAVLDGR